MTDVNISVALLGDAQDDLFDTAMIVSADSDLVGPVQAVLRRYPEKRVLIAFPPRRVSVTFAMSQAHTSSSDKTNYGVVSFLTK